MNIEQHYHGTLPELFNELCDFGGRLSGSESEREALEFAQKWLKALPSGKFTTHDVAYDGWRSESAWIELGETRYDVVALPGGTSLHDPTQRLELVDVGRGTPDDFNRLRSRVRGRAVIVTHEYMFDVDHIHRCRKTEMAHTMGASVFVIASPYENNGAVSGGIDPKMPAFGVDKTTGDALRQAARDNQSAVFHLNNRESRMQTLTLDWVLEPKYSRESDHQEVIVCAHIDGHANAESAIDNASGAAVALAIAREAATFSKNEYALRVLIFSAEEFGLLGSQTYVEQLNEEQKARINAVINLDCVAGSLDFTAMTSGFDGLEKIVSGAADRCGVSVRIYDKLTKNSDHYNFAVAGIPALRLIAGFGEPMSKLRYVLTDSDTRDLVTEEELDSALNLTSTMVRLAGESRDA